ncbi:D-alanine--D-alanine ligase [Methylophaga nitratireducenticrescens]|uniref:D-alanine--D-alanine ligase n=1 Tax=Methylophaga nitratireducenticrescens TaxID=754476 RepID=I1XHJ2_METNJ|nr:D-alanine--D-alanine ligase [Methylophaga nitratireducenticrescens]AFI83861.1 D-alanine--D-alanine ligase [Methylophaga nitratireducenticrescens]AUZ83978.1 D-alanine--D-alanine ligase [Methylophaga nitratireducenticrescens]
MSEINMTPQSFGRVAVLMGGRSAEREISLKSGRAVLAALQSLGVDAVGLDVDKTVSERIHQDKFDRAFIILHGRGGEDGEIQGVLQSLQIPYTGSGITGAVLSMNKRLSKQIWQSQGLPTPKYVRLNRQSTPQQIVEELGLPLVIKPVNEGSSIGMSKVTSVEALQQAISLAFDYDDEVIAEQWVHGAEYTVSILNGEALPVIRLTTPREFYDFEAKYLANSTEYLCPCGLSDADEKRCQQLAITAFHALNMSGWGRIDVMADQQGDFYLLEANSVPGMTDHSLVPMSARQAGISFENLVGQILKSSLEDKR